MCLVTTLKETILAKEAPGGGIEHTHKSHADIDADIDIPFLDPQVDNVSLTVKKVSQSYAGPFLNNKTCRGREEEE